jgi:hypothetical protein
MDTPRLLRIILLLAAAVPGLAVDDWLAVGPGAALRRSGQTIVLEYKVVPGQLGLAARPIAEGKLAGMTHLRFRLRTDAATPVACVLHEKKPGGGDYSAIFWSPRDQWQQIDLTPADFVVNDGAKDPVDSDGRLDLDQVQSLGIVDLGQLFSQITPNPKLPIAVMKHSGGHKLQIEDFRISTESTPAPAEFIDDFHRDFLDWFTLGGAELALSKSGNPLGKPALQFSYRQDPAQFVVAARMLSQADFRDATQLEFDVASSHAAHLAISIQEQKIAGREGPRYNFDFQISAGATGHIIIPFSELTLAEESQPGPSGYLDVGRVRSISLVDISGIVDGATGNNTVWLTAMRTQ